MLAATPPRRIWRSFDEEGQRDLVELLDQEAVGEAAVEDHQVVGGDGPGDGDPHQRTLQRRLSRPADRSPAPPGGARGAGRRQVSTVSSADQWKLSPQAQLPPALGLSMVKPCFSIVSAKSIVAPGGRARSSGRRRPRRRRSRARGHRRGCARRSRAGRSGPSSRPAGRRRAGAGRRGPPAPAGS